MIWRWELTPREAFTGFKLVRTSPQQRVGAERVPWRGPELPMPGHPALRMKFGIADHGHAIDIAAIRRSQPELPTTGDRRSGILVLDGGAVVGNYTITGDRPRPYHRLVVDPAYRGLGLGVAMVTQWSMRTMRPKLLSSQMLNAGGVRAFVDAQVAVTQWAHGQGREVAPRVIESLESERTYILDIAAAVAADGEPRDIQPASA